MADMLYCYPDSSVLINKLDIREQKKLEIFERKLTMLRLLELIDKPLDGDFDFRHLKEIHRYIFRIFMIGQGKCERLILQRAICFVM